MEEAERTPPMEEAERTPADVTIEQDRAALWFVQVPVSRAERRRLRSRGQGYRNRVSQPPQANVGLETT
jgi:hypothetical protein